MKTPFAAFLLALATALASACSSNDPEPQPTPTAEPVGPITALRSGTIAPQNGTPTGGTLSVVRDAQNQEFVQLNPDFMSDFHTGTVTIYLAKAGSHIGTQRTAAATNVQSVGLVNKNGAQYLRLTGKSEGFSHVVFYCESAAINFGAAPLQ